MKALATASVLIALLVTATGPRAAEAQAQVPRPVLSFINVERDITINRGRSGARPIFCPGAYQFVSFSFGSIGPPTPFGPQPAFVLDSIVPNAGGNGVTPTFSNRGPTPQVQIRTVASCVLLGDVAGQRSSAGDDAGLPGAEAAQRRRQRRRRPARPRLRTGIERKTVRVPRPRRRGRARGSADARPAAVTTRITVVCDDPNSAPASFGFRARNSQLLGVTPARSRGNRGFRARFRTQRRDRITFYVACIRGTGRVRLASRTGRSAAAPGARAAGDPLGLGSQVLLQTHLLTLRDRTLEPFGDGSNINRFPPPNTRPNRLVFGAFALPTTNLAGVKAMGFDDQGQIGTIIGGPGPVNPPHIVNFIEIVAGADLDVRRVSPVLQQSIAAFSPLPVTTLPPAANVPPASNGPPANGPPSDAPPDGGTFSKDLNTTVICPDTVDDAPVQYVFTFFIPNGAFDVSHEFLQPAAAPMCPGTTGDFPGALEDPAMPPPTVPAPPAGMKAVRVRVSVTGNPDGTDTSRDGPPVGVSLRVTYTVGSG